MMNPLIKNYISCFKIFRGRTPRFQGRRGRGEGEGGDGRVGKTREEGDKGMEVGRGGEAKKKTAPWQIMYPPQVVPMCVLIC